MPGANFLKTVFVNSGSACFPSGLSLMQKKWSRHCQRLPVVLARQSRQPLCFFHLDSRNYASSSAFTLQIDGFWEFRYNASGIERSGINVIFMPYTPLKRFKMNSVTQINFTMAWAQVKVSKFISTDFLNEKVYSLQMNLANKCVLFCNL